MWAVSGHEMTSSRTYKSCRVARVSNSDWRERRPVDHQSDRLWKRSLFSEWPASDRHLSCQAIGTRRRFPRACLLVRIQQNWSFSPGTHIALQNKEEMARPTRLEPVTFAFGEQRPHAAIIARALLTENVAVPSATPSKITLSLESLPICGSASHSILPLLKIASEHPSDIHAPSTWMVEWMDPWPIMYANCDPKLPTPRKSLSTLAMSTSVTSISWCRKGSIRTGPISSERPFGTSSNAMQTSSGNPRPERAWTSGYEITPARISKRRGVPARCWRSMFWAWRPSPRMSPPSWPAPPSLRSRCSAPFMRTPAVKAALADRMR